MKVKGVIAVCLVSTTIAVAPRHITAAKESFNAKFVRLQNQNSISGYVFDQRRQPVALINVELLDEFYRTITRVRTEQSGRYIFSRVPSGRVYVRVLPIETGFEDQTKEVEIVNITSETTGGFRRGGFENVQLDFYLRPLKATVAGNSAGSIFVQEVPKEAEAEFQLAVADFDNNKIDSAIVRLEAALKVFPDYFAALERLGVEQAKQQQFEAAQNVLTRAVKINSRGYNSWYTLGYSQLALKKLTDAREAVQKAAALNPSSPQAPLLLGVVFRQLKNYSEAEKQFLLSDKNAKGKDPNAHWQLSLLYAYNLNRFDDAAKHLQLFLKTQPKSKDSEAIKKLIQQFKQKAASQ